MNRQEAGRLGGRPKLQTLEERQLYLARKLKRSKPPSGLKELARLWELQRSKPEIIRAGGSG